MEEQSIVTESRHQSLVRSGKAHPRFIQGIFPFIGAGITERLSLAQEAEYLVPKDCQAEVLYLRAGNHSQEIVYLTLCADSRAIRYFPLGKGGAMHIPLAIIEAHPAGTCLSLQISAVRGESGVVILDLGLLEVLI